MAIEVMSFGLLSKMYQCLENEVKIEIAKNYQIQIVHNVFGSWLHSFTYIRNLCAHNARIWNRKLFVKPQIPHFLHNKFENIDNLEVILELMEFVIIKAIADEKTISNWQIERKKLNVTPVTFF
jgi:abortive infection bacteriophage resistance protein